MRASDNQAALKLCVAATLIAAVPGFGQDGATASGSNCTFQRDPDSFLTQQARGRREVFERARSRNAMAASAAGAERFAVSAATLPRRNLIDDAIFGKLAAKGIPSAPLSTDEEFFRRIHLDLTGRLPAPADTRAFAADKNADKRNKIIGELLYSDAFTDKWTMWFGDLLQNTTASITQGRATNGRNAMYTYIWGSVAGWKSIADIAYEAVVMRGNNHDIETGAAGFAVNSQTPGGPIQDSYDTMLVKTATAFLGQSNYDCLLCHNGRGHLDQLNVWGANTLRTDAWKMAAFFSRLSYAGYTFPAGTTADEQRASYYNQSRIINDRTTGQYDLGSNYGNRPNRTITGTTRNMTPVYQSSGATPKSNYWRFDFAESMVNDPMFARNFANRLWKAMFNMALADPVDQLDPARLDPNNPPPDPWTFQATHPELLEQLAKELRSRNFNLREFLRLIAESSAYQLSSRYSGEWELSYVPLFARHYPRRLDAEEVHDAVAKATGNFPKLAVNGWANPVQWAMQLPDTLEGAGSSAFLNYFLRGNRDTQPRSQQGSIQQQLALMNDTFVTNKIHVAQSPNVAAIGKLTDNSQMADEMFLTFLGRFPDSYEKGKAVAALAKATTTAQKNAALEDMAWALINKLDFLFSY
ncbi:MAG: DUF1553 domain-containing protein [Bryobacteraceae bacterium]